MPETSQAKATSQPTVEDWIRGWALAHVPDQETAELMARNGTKALAGQIESLRPETPLTDPIRKALEKVMGTLEDEEARSPRECIRRVLTGRVPKEVAEAAASPAADSMLNGGDHSWGIDPGQKLPPGLAAGIEQHVGARLSSKDAETLEEVYEKRGAAGIQRLYNQ